MSRRATYGFTAAYAFALVVLSVLPSGRGALGGWDEDISPSLQNVLHVPAYALLVVLTWRSVSLTRRGDSARLVLSALACGVFGTVLELAQVFIPGRSASVLDAVLNGVGVLAGVGTLALIAWKAKRALKVSQDEPGKATRRQRRRWKCREMVRKHYHERGWRSATSRYEDVLSELIVKPCVVLDVGCGHDFPMAGRLLSCGAEVHGIDVMPVLPLEVSGVTVKRASAERIPYPDNSFDVITMRSVLEHMKRPAAAFRDLHRVLKPAGRMVFLAPNEHDYVSLVARIVPNSLHGGVLKWLEGRSEADTFPTYYRANSARRIAELAANTGFVIEHIEYVNHYPYLLTFSPFLCRTAIAYDELIRGRKSLQWLQAWLLGVLRSTKAESKTLPVSQQG